MSLSLLVILAVLATGITAMPNGAPASQCDSFLPLHPPSNPGPSQVGAPPFEIILNNFPLVNSSDVDGPRTFVCGGTYTVIINSTDAVNFRGFLIQARLYDSDGMLGAPFGQFVELPAAIGATVMARYGDCLPAQSSATHNHAAGTNSSTREDFPYVSLRWTAPSDETECQDKVVRFRYTAVQLFATWWGPRYSAALVAPAAAAAATSTTAMVTVMFSMILFSLGLMQ